MTNLNQTRLLICFFVLSPFLGLSQCEVDAGDDVWICPGESVMIGGDPTLVETPGGPFTWEWDNGIGEVENPEVSPTVTTTYTISIEGAGPCDDQDEVTVFVYNPPVADFSFSPDGVCADIPIQFSNLSSGVDLEFFWEFGDGSTSESSNPEYSFDTIGNGVATFDVTLTVTDENGCTDSATQTVTLDEVPDPVLVDPTFSYVNCNGEDEFSIAVIDDSSPASNANYTIDWGDGSTIYDSTNPPNPGTASHTYTGLDIWTLTYTVLGTNGCATSMEQLVANITNPAMGASTNGNTTVCGPVDICFNLTNFEANHESTTYTVNFGDGSAAEIFAHPPPNEVCHEYSSSSCEGGIPFVFEVEATNVCTFSEATISPITIFTPPSAGFYPDPVPQCVNVPVTFVNTSTLGYYTGCGQNGTFFWDFGDGSTAFSITNDNQSHAYDAPGTYTVTLEAYNACNSSEPSIFTQEVCIEEAPTPSFTTSPDGCVPFEISPVNTSVIPQVCQIGYTWTIGTLAVECATGGPNFEFVDGSTLNDETPIIQINNPGTYELEMTMANSCGIFTYTDIVQAFDIPQADVFSLPDICAGSSASPSAIYEDCNTAITDYAWTFEGGSPATSASSNPGSVTWASGGNWDVGLTVTNQCGSSTASTSITVQNAPVVSVSSSAGTVLCAGEGTTLTASGASSYTWTFDPDLSGTSGAVTTAFPDTDNTFFVTGFSTAGCPGNGSVSLDVQPLPIVTAAATYEICAGETIPIGVDVTSGSGSYTDYTWSPGGSLSDAGDSNPNASPVVTTTYDVSVTDSNNCTGLGEVDVIVNQLPIVEAGDPLQVCNQPVAEELTGYGPIAGAGESGTWSGSGVTSDGFFTPSGVGIVTLTYTFIDANGCESSDDLEVEVIEPATADAGSDLSFCADGNPVVLSPVTGGGSWSGSFVESDGTFTPSDPGLYNLTYSLGGGSCLSIDFVDVEVLELPVVDAGADLILCEGDSVQMNAGVSGGLAPYTGIDWTPGAAVESPDVLDPWITPLSSAVYSLSVTDSNGCTGSDNVEIDVDPTPVVEAGPNLVLCNQPIPENLAGFGPLPGAGQSAEWTGTGVSPDGVFTPFAEAEVVLTYTFTNEFGCLASDSITVDVVEPVAADAGPDLELCQLEAAVQLSTDGAWTGPGVTPGGLFEPLTTGVFDLQLTVGVGTCATQDDMQVEVLELPNVDAGETSSMCAEGTVLLDGEASSSNGAITDWLWTGDPSIIDPDLPMTLVSPLVTTTFTLEVTDAAGCQASDDVDVNVSSLPIVEAGPDLVVCDQPIAEDLSGFSPVAGAGESGVWSGTGITDPAGVFESPGVGSYWAYYTFTDAGGCSDLDSILVDVVEPVVAVAGPDVEICLNNGLLTLEDFTPLTGYAWSGEGVIDPAGVFDASLEGPGTYTLTIETGAGTCFSTDELEVEVLDLPVVSVLPLDGICANLGEQVLAGNSPVGGTWEGSGITDGALGNFDPSIGAGDYELLYWYTDPATGCADSTLVPQVVHPVPVADFELAALGCTNASVDVNNTSSDADFYAWDFGNGDTGDGFDPGYTYPDPGFFDVELVASNVFGCADVTMESHEVINPPEAGLSLSPNEGCAPIEISFENQSVGTYLEYEWDLSVSTTTEESPWPVIYEQGDDVVIYPVTLTATNFCGSALAEDMVTVYPQPIAAFGTDLDVFCSPFTVAFNDLSTGNPDTWWWDFDDGTFSGSDEPGTHVFFADTIAVDYTISLVVENECGIDSTEYTITTLPNTVTAFFNTNITEGCEPLEVEFTDFSEGGTEISYDFGDDFLSGDQSPVHVFNTPGIYTVQQFVTNGCSFDTAEVQITVFDAADMSFITDVPNVCSDQPVQFINTSEGVSSVTWDFGDGTTTDLTNPTHLYEEGGTFTVTLTGTTLFTNCPGVTTETFTVFESPEANFEVAETLGCSPFTVNFDNDSEGGLFYQWEFGDGNIDDATSPEHTYINDTGLPMSVNVILIAESFELCSDTAELSLVVAPTPVAAFDLSDTESCSFPISITTFNNSIWGNSYDWDFGPYGTSDLTNPNVIYDAEGVFPVSLTVSNAYGCSDTEVSEVAIHPSPEAWFSAAENDGCVPLEVSFVNESEGDVDLQWQFGDGGVSMVNDPLHLYPFPGDFDVSLIATNEFGCTDTTTFADYVSVYPLPVASFSMSTTQANVYQPVIDFYDESFNAVQWVWSFGDGAQAFEQNPTHLYQTAGLFTAELTVISENGCISTTTRSLTIDDRFNLYVPNTFTPDDDGINDVFFPQITGKSLIEEFEMSVWDRWGHRVWYSEDPDAVWIGDLKGGGEYFVQDDVYVWQVKVRIRGEDDSRYLYGHVTQLR